MLRHTLILSALALGTLLASTEGVSAQSLRLETRLTGTTRASGTAKFERRDARMKFNVQIEDAPVSAGFGVVVRRGTQIVYRGVLRTSALGRGVIDIDNTEGDIVPAMRSGDLVIVNFGQTRLLTGTLRPR